MLMYTVSLNSGTPEQVAAVEAEMEESLGFGRDTLSLLIKAEEENDPTIGGLITDDIE